jgi:hypothetical protein
MLRSPFFALIAGLSCLGAAPSPVDWSGAATEDLVAIHDIIQANHPGAADAQNPAFTGWLDGGERQLLPAARRAATAHDYQLVLRDYVNGFADGHVNIAMTDPESYLWPGFLVRADALTAPVRVAVLGDARQAPAGLAVGDQLLACGDVPVRDRLRDRVLRPLLNPHVPQRLALKSAWLMVADADDPGAQAASCRFRTAAGERTIALKWYPIAPPALAREIQQSAAIDIPPIGVRRIDDVWLISLPTFDPQGAQVARMQALIAYLQSHAAALHAARHVVIDLRGNDGGDDAWGDDVLSSLWRGDTIEAIENSVSERIEWRVSTRNIAALDLNAVRARRDGHADVAGYYTDLAQRMAQAAALHHVFMEEDAPASARRPARYSPFAHPVYLLTTPYCASACLDFIDVANELGGTVRVGLETSSDTDYLDTAGVTLPSGHAVLHYAMKLYRERPRPANASYRPDIAWPGGDMTDASIATWIETLP